MRMGTRISASLLAEARAWADQWKAVWLCTEPAEWERWERGAREVYSAAGLPFPSRFVHVDNPFTLGIAAALASSAWAGDPTAAHRMMYFDNVAIHAAVAEAVRGMSAPVPKAPKQGRGEGVNHHWLVPFSLNWRMLVSAQRPSFRTRPMHVRSILGCTPNS
jgi:hypothetical protein